MRIVIAPDSFKGTLSALQAAQAIARGIRRVLPDADIQLFPMADGGEGTLDAVLFATQGERHSTTVSGVAGAPVQAAYAVLADGTVVIEVAQVVGLSLIQGSTVAHRSTRGVGELIHHCLGQGLRRFMIGLGGSSTNDAGAGLLAALGVQLHDAHGASIAPTPAGLESLTRVAFGELDPRLASCDITLMTDVDNPLCGPSGATVTFGPQKGVTQEEVSVFDARLANFARLCDARLGNDCAQRPGAGAAGGLGYALMLLGGQRRSGAEVVCEMMQLDAALLEADWVITGEGRSDAQTLHGKLPWVVAQHARRSAVPVVLMSGAIDDASRQELAHHFDDCRALVGEGVALEQAMHAGEQYLALCAEAWAGKVTRQ